MKRKNRPCTLPTKAKETQSLGRMHQRLQQSQSAAEEASASLSANCARPEFSSCLVDRGNRIRVFPVGDFEASLLENLRRLDTMITEEVAKESSDITCLGVRRLVVRLERIFILAQVLVVCLVTGYGRCVGCRGDVLQAVWAAP